MNTQEFQIICKRELAEKFTGNKNYIFKHSDFLELSEEIYHITKVSLSLSTLRRFFSETEYRKVRISTLNVFAEYLGFNNWKDYCKNKISDNEKVVTKKSRNYNIRLMLFYALSGIIIIPGVYFLIRHSSKHSFNMSTIEFNYNSYDSTKIPSTITFNYNIRNARFDSATFHPMGFLEKELDDIRLLNSNDTTVTYTYLLPGCYYPKLVMDGEIIKQQRINFVTNNWIASLSQYRPFHIKYLEENSFSTNGKLHLTKEMIKRSNITGFEIEQTSYQIFKDFKNIYGDSLNFKTKIKNNILNSASGDLSVGVDLFFSKENIHLFLKNELSSLQETGLWVVEKYHSSRNEDLSFLFENLTKWNTIQCKTFDKKFELHINDSLVYQTYFTKDIGTLIGIRYIFFGLGEVDYVKFFNQKGKIIYNDEFN